MSKTSPTKLELLAPARNAETAIAAITAGADAVYIGASSHGARHAAANSVSDIARVADYAHQFKAKVFATVNTIIYDDELAEVERLIGELYRAGVDALIVQDMAVLRMDIPPIELHASTQCDIRDAAKARFLADAGFSRLVLARELSLREMAEIHEAVPDTPLEAFIHGALCVSYSGDCRASFATTGRSANRGECAQICRLPFNLIDRNGNTLIKNRHLLSLRDLNRSAVIPEMVEAGISSFKIEGRLKDESYVRNVVGAYSNILDKFINESGGRYIRQSVGDVRLGFKPSLDKSFNRGFTSYFLTGKAPSGGMASTASPKATGLKVGTVTNCRPKVITARLDANLANGDGLGYFTPAGLFRGFRLNRVEGNKLFPATPQDIPSGTILYRNRDKEFDDKITSATTSRTIAVDMALRVISSDRIALEMTDARGCHAVVTAEGVTLQEAVTPQETPRRRILDKLGGTIYRSRRIVDLAGAVFIPASILANLRRDCIAALDKTAKATYGFTYRLPEKFDIPLPHGPKLSVHDNVANRLARDFYISHGATVIDPAIEVADKPKATSNQKNEPVMTTRYCLRREFGKCLKTPSGKDWEERLTLVSADIRLRLDFDCSNCRMNVYTD
ncbi:MAG: U32 family peptidase [Bacteroides sp.]|nr:U32 family peptidase [Bacteroides sp.]